MTFQSLNIAVLFGEIAYISRSKIIDGILHGAKRDKNNIILFTCEGFLFHDMKDYIHGEYNIFKLPAVEQYDGIIVDFDSIQNEHIQKYLYENIRYSNVPCVSFNRDMEEAGIIEFDNKSGFEKLVEHLIKEHDVKDIVYLSGPEENQDSIERKKILFDVLQQHEISLPDENIYEGDFNYGSGKMLARKYLKSGKKLPQAFIAANDFMAIGLMEELKENGIKIPEDVIITGYDNCDVASATEPRLTTVDRQEFEAGCQAYEELMQNIKEIQELPFSSNGVSRSQVTMHMYHNHFAKKYINKHIVMHGKPVFAESCGCKNKVERITYGQSVVELNRYMDESLDLIKGLSIRLAGMDSMVSFEQILEKYVEKIGMEYFYFCQNGSRESYYDELEILASGKQVKRNMSVYMDHVWCPIAYENGEWNSYPSFSRRLLFPPNSQYQRQGSFYIVMPVHQGEICIGYSIIGNFHNHLSGRVLQHLILDIDDAIGNIRKNDIMTTMLAKINQKWQYDELTGLYNRSGMLERAERMIEEANVDKLGICVTFFDLDGLKIINDTLGHEAGDRYIKSMADMLLKATTSDDIVTRYGGDEYVVLSKRKSRDESIQELERLQNAILEPVSASAGCVFNYVRTMNELNRMIEEADRRMYEYKKIKKRERNS